MKSCCVIGHRKINNLDVILLTNKFIKLIQNNIVVFKFGNYGEFNELCFNILSKLRLEYPQIKLVFYSLNNEIAYTFDEAKEFLSKYNRKNKEFEYKCFDEIIELKDIDETKFKLACVLRNKKLIDESDFCLFYYKNNYLLLNSNGMQRNSGTHIAYEYACKQKKKIIII